MARSRIQHSLLLCATGAAALVALRAAEREGLRMNLTPSMPVGLWQLVATHSLLKRGDIVIVCLPDGSVARQAVERGYIASGSCPGGTEPLVKPVAAASGDLVTVSATGVSVNADPIANTAPLLRDDAGRELRPLPPELYRVSFNEVWLLSGYDRRSFDSRYFGAVPVANVLGVARPLWVLP